MGYSVDYLIDFSVTTDLKNSSWRILDLDQPGLGMSREYLSKGIQDEDVQVSIMFEKSQFLNGTDLGSLIGNIQNGNFSIIMPLRVYVKFTFIISKAKKLPF